MVQSPRSGSRWVSVRSEPQTLFMRDARRLIREHDERCTISVMAQHPWSYRGAPDDTPYAGSRDGLLSGVPGRTARATAWSISKLSPRP